MLDHEPIALPHARVACRVRDAKAQAAARLEDARDLLDGFGHVVDVHQRVVGDDEVEHAVGKRQDGGVADDVGRPGVGLEGQLDELADHVDTGDGVAARREIPRHAAFAAADLERRAPGRWYELEERVPVVPVRVVAGRPRPFGPASGLSVPVPGAAHEAGPR